MQEERWRPIEEFPDYLISDRGRISNVHTGHILKQFQRADTGLFQVTLSREGVHYNRSVHKLVAIAYLEEPAQGEVAVHKNHDRSNNSVENLRWMSRALARWRVDEQRNFKPWWKTMKIYEVTYRNNGLELVKEWESMEAVITERGGLYNLLHRAAGLHGSVTYLGSLWCLHKQNVTE